MITAIAPAAVPSAILGPNGLCANTSDTYSVTNDPTVVYNWTIPLGWTGISTTNSITITCDAAPGNIEVNAENIAGPLQIALLLLQFLRVRQLHRLRNQT